ncbi:hypothetical protein PMAYCL1PPCAC_03599, partial [Pristionchus mayeri]
LILFLSIFFLTWAFVSLVNTIRLYRERQDVRSAPRFLPRSGHSHSRKDPILNRPSTSPPNAREESIGIRAQPRRDKSMNISMIIIVTQGTNGLKKYERALNSLRCYSLVHQYPLHVIVDDVYLECQRYKDKFFRRHCTIERFMESRLRPSDWLLVMDADIAVINPNILLEKYVDDLFDITLFDRFFNWEVAALSYLVRNTERGRKFVRDFASWEFKLPNVKGHGTDNGALHPYLMELLAPGPSKIKDVCYEIWNRSESS